MGAGEPSGGELKVKTLCRDLMFNFDEARKERVIG
jgi:hypothetical protein